MAKRILKLSHIPRYTGNDLLTFDMRLLNDIIVNWGLSVSELGYILKLSTMSKNQYNALITKDNNIHTLQTISVELGMNYSRCSQLMKQLDQTNICKKITVEGCNLFTLNPYVVHNNQIIDVLIYNKFAELEYGVGNPDRRSKKINKINTETDGDNIYLLEHIIDTNTTYYKIGYSKNIEGRLKAYLLHNPSIKLIKTWKVQNPKNYEHEIHSNFEAIYNKEWYSKETLEKICTHLNLNIEL